jgi:hypothetical protein
MTPRRSVRARRVEATDEIRAIDTLDRPDYLAAWEAEVPMGAALSAEQWARAVFEDAPRELQAFIVAGWTAGLGLRLGPRPSVEHVLGWKITVNQPDLIILEVRFRFGTAHNVVRVENSRVQIASYVRNEKWGGRAAWALVAPLHQQILPYLLGRAASGSQHATT